MSHITANLYTAHIPREIDRGAAWYTDQCELGKQAAEKIKRRMGWGLTGKFPVEALEQE